MLPGIGWTELLVIAVLAIVVIGPKDLPRAMRTIGRFVGKARAMAREFQSSFEEIAREAEMEEMRTEAEKLREAMTPVMTPLSAGPPAALSANEEEALVAAHNAKILETEASAMASGAQPAATAEAEPPVGADNVTPIRGARR
jgi:sec-independent protein translocase protein TatB